jgi:hypothetical protein
MGYRSNTAYVIRFKNKEHCDAFINIQLAKADKWITEAINELTRVEDNVLGWHEEHVKWYDDYEDVKAHKILMSDAINLFGEDNPECEAYDDQAGYRFVRLGEEDDDNNVEEEGNSEQLYEYIEWYRKLDVEFTVKPIGKQNEEQSA